MNYTRPGRLHIISNKRSFYFTLILFGRRLHFTWSRKGIPDEPLWS